MNARTLTLIGLILSCVVKGLATSYSTTFSSNQNPLSENGNWVNGTVTGKYTACAVTNNAAGLHYAYGLQPGPGQPPWNDSVAVLNGGTGSSTVAWATNWGPTQMLTLTIYCTNQLSSVSNVYEEIEYGLHCTVSNNWFDGYWMDCSLNKDAGAGYIEIGLNYAGTNNVTLLSDHGLGPVTNGTTLTAAITNNTITVTCSAYPGENFTVTDNSGYSIPTGAPCIGLFHQTVNAHQTDFGISSFYATDGVKSSAPTPAVSLSWSTNGIAGTATNSAIVTLTWSSANATNVTLSGFGGVPLSGSTNASPSQTTNYTLTATGADGTASTNVTVIVPAPPTNLKAVQPQL